MTDSNVLIPVERIEKAILLIRGQKVMLSTHLAELYDVQPKVLVQAVKRNLDRFPSDFMFRLTLEELRDLRKQFATSSDSSAYRLRSQFVTLKRGSASSSMAKRSKPEIC